MTLTIANWEAWAPDRTTKRCWTAWAHGRGEIEERRDDAGFLDPMLRRRLGPLGREALGVAYRCLGGRKGVPTVFASRHGELGRTLGMLRGLAAGEALSPTTFSLSVHNAAAGIFAIAHHDHAPATALAAGDETFGMGLVEALSRLSPEHEAVLLVYSEEPIPGEYRRYIGNDEEPHALALLLSHAGDCRLDMSTQPATGCGEVEMMSISFLRMLAGAARQVTWSGERLSWTWSRRDG